jgi:hypothetical protein
LLDQLSWLDQPWAEAAVGDACVEFCTATSGLAARSAINKPSYSFLKAQFVPIDTAFKISVGAMTGYAEGWFNTGMVLCAGRMILLGIPS